ncbi:MAG: alpha/beta hydrolase [Planctomycetaceae bacterium]
MSVASKNNRASRADEADRVEAPSGGGASVPVSASAVADEPREPCPTPLDWREVLAEFRAAGDPWEIDFDGSAISGRTIGAGPPLYFLNGLVGSHETYALLAWLLREEFRCVLFDHPAPRNGSRTRDAMIEHVRALSAIADAHGDVRFDVFASGFGGLVALAAMAKEGNRVRRAAIHAGFAHRRLTLAERTLIRLGRWCPGRLRHVPMLRTILRANHLPWFPPFDQSRYDFLESDALATPIRDAAARADALRSCDLRPRLAEIDVPVLLIRTEGEGAAATAAQQELESGLKHARSEWLHTTGPAAFLTHPHRVAKLIREFAGSEPPA